MESLTTASKILSQLRQLTDGMALICLDFNALKCGNMTQCNPSIEADDNGMLAYNSYRLTSQPSDSKNSGFSPKNTASNGQTALWTEEMDLRDPLPDLVHSDLRV